MRFYHSCLRFIYEIYLRGKLFSIIILRNKSNRRNSYYPEYKLKSRFRQFVEEAIHVLKYGEINRFYQLYGFDVIGFRNSRDYIDYRSFMKRRNRLNLLPMNYSCILRDKSLFSVVATSYGFPCIKELGTYLATDNKVIPANIKCFEGGGFCIYCGIIRNFFLSRMMPSAERVFFV